MTKVIWLVECREWVMLKKASRFGRWIQETTTVHCASTEVAAVKWIKDHASSLLEGQWYLLTNEVLNHDPEKDPDFAYEMTKWGSDGEMLNNGPLPGSKPRRKPRMRFRTRD